LEKALQFLGQISPRLRASSFYTSTPVDCAENAPLFLNAVAEIEFSDGLMYLLEKFQAYELERGRPRERQKNSARPIDLDLLYAAELEMQTPRLTLPHPRMLERLFVMEPLAEICPDLILPGQTKTVRDLLAQLKRNEHDQLCRKIS
jgi:2-amino-4-hydroxy-6-hydroxymethyldihydropteridine diphosphokinase